MTGVPKRHDDVTRWEVDFFVGVFHVDVPKKTESISSRRSGSSFG